MRCTVVDNTDPLTLHLSQIRWRGSDKVELNCIARVADSGLLTLVSPSV